MEKATKKSYVTPTLKEHGMVRELTQSSSGGRKKKPNGWGRPKTWKFKKRKKFR
jgi:hypothetical protein